MARQPDTSTHKLSAEEHGRIFSDAIEPILLGKVKTRHQSKPRLIMLGGQPGSGKTSRLLFSAQDELDAQGGFVAIDADHFRTFHPQWDELNQQDDRNAALYTHPDAAEWVNRAIDVAIREGCHVIFDGTMGSPGAALNRIEQFERAGYDIEIRILAVNERHSWLGVLRRYEEGRARSGAGRMTPRDVHDEVYEGLVKTLETIQSEKSGVRIRIYSRDKSLLFDTRNGGALGTRTAAQALQDERERPWTASEEDEFRDSVKQLIQLATMRGADSATLSEYRKLQPGLR